MQKEFIIKLLNHPRGLKVSFSYRRGDEGFITKILMQKRINTVCLARLGGRVGLHFLIRSVVIIEDR